MDAYFCWGKYDYKHMKINLKKKFFSSQDHQELICGKKNAYVLEKDIIDKNYVLFVSNFNYPNNVYSYKELIRRRESKLL